MRIRVIRDGRQRWKGLAGVDYDSDRVRMEKTRLSEAGTDIGSVQQRKNLLNQTHLGCLNLH